MVLSKDDIVQRCCQPNALIENYCEKNIQACSYDLRMGDQYYYYKNEDGDTVNISYLNEGESLKIPPDSICYVMTAEKVNMPQDLTASISLSFGLIKRGVMLAAQPPYDPGYQGKTVALLHNLSNKTVTIKRGEHILNIVFTRLCKRVNSANQYKGNYQGLNNLEDYCKEVRVGAVFELKQELEEARKKVDKILPHILTAITVIIATLTVLFTILFGASSINQLFPSKSQAETDVTSTSYFNFSVDAFDEETNILTISIDGKSYKIELKEESMSQEEKPEQSNENLVQPNESLEQ